MSLDEEVPLDVTDASPTPTTRGPFTARPTIFNGVRMRSRLEAGFAQWADSHGLGPEYEPAAFANEEGQYLPDFRLRYVQVEGRHHEYPFDGVVWVEVKPTLPTGRALIDLRTRMEIIRSSEPDAVLAIVYKDPAPGVLLSLNSGWWPAAWTIGARPFNVGLVRPYTDRESLPWPTGYWQGPQS